MTATTTAAQPRPSPAAPPPFDVEAVRRQFPVLAPRPHDWATRFTPSVVPRVKITSRGSAPRKRATFLRAPSKAAVARSARS